MTVEEEAKSLGLVVHTWSPGDGQTRYRFFYPETNASNYFEGNGICTTLGRAEALAFLKNYRLAKYRYAQNETK